MRKRLTRLSSKLASLDWDRVLLILVLALVLVGILALIVVPGWQVAGITANRAKGFELENKARKTIIQIVGGLFALIALILTWRRVKVTEQGHITDRYTKAIEQLGKLDVDKPNIELRLGGIYALERIARDSPRDHWPIMEVLTAYVRSNAPLQTEPADQTKPGVDIQAILTVLARRRRDGRREEDEQRLDLRRTDLRGAYLTDAHLEGAIFEGADLQRASLVGAHLEGAFLAGARLDGARLYAAGFEDARGLIPEQIKSADGWEAAYYSPEFERALALP
jgi:hypothetical protein